MEWSTEKMPDLEGRIALITGANSGLGFCTALELAKKGASVFLGCRSRDKGIEAKNRILEQSRHGEIEAIEIDLADLSSVRNAASVLQSKTDHLDLLINNAGVMALPYRHTNDGFEMQIGTNHLGHFALTGLVLPLLGIRTQSRVVTLSSLMHRRGKIRFEDINWKSGYKKWRAYSQSKLANLLFMYELDRYARRHGLDILSVAAHPGYASTELQAAGAKMTGSRFKAGFMRLGNRLIAQSAEKGAWPTLFAATAPEVNGGDFFGPSGWLELRGVPKKVESNQRSHNESDAKRLWELSENLTGVVYTR